jgi:hypothetical protein
MESNNIRFNYVLGEKIITVKILTIIIKPFGQQKCSSTHA